MRWLFGFVLLLLALGVLRLVGCGDEGPGRECIYPSDATGTVRDPTCDDENECTEGRCSRGNTCDNYGGFRDGEPCDSGSVPDVCSTAICVWDRCEIAEKPCEVVPHEDCGWIETYDCDPKTGVVECTLYTGPQGQSCCLESTTGCYSCDAGLCCGWRCLRSGWCIDGPCVTSPDGYPRDCADTDYATPCRVGDTIGLCWKGDCAVVDCQGFGTGTLCWFGGSVGRCGGGLLSRCHYDHPSGGGPPGWTCAAEYYGTADGCDCGCGAIDPDCADGAAASCHICNAPGSCTQLSCEDDIIDPTQNWLCEW